MLARLGGFFTEWLLDDLVRMMFGVIVTMFGVALPNVLLSGFGLGVVFSSTLNFYWQRKRVERDRARG